MWAHLQTRRPARAMHSRAHGFGAYLSRHIVTLTVALLAAVLLLLSRTANGAEVALSVNIAPPPLPVYEQPPLPSPGYLWVPGYWGYGPEGYFWVPGTWVLPPDPDLMWTPGYWGWSDGAYLWNAGYWAPEVGFYGGIVYGFGYFGHGYDGGYWREGQFYYNRAVNNVGNTHLTSVYSAKVTNVTVNNVSYNGGPGGVNQRPTPQEQAAARLPRHAPTSVQLTHVASAGAQRELLAAVNQGKPPVAATPKPNTFPGPGERPAAPAERAAPPPPRRDSPPPQSPHQQQHPPPSPHQQPPPTSPHQQQPPPQ